jgi:hypothetical protein
MTKQGEAHRPWKPVKWEPADALAIQALAGGTADPDQQKRALGWIIHTVCGTYDQSFHPGGEEGRRDSDFAEGKRFVGTTLVKMTRLNVGGIRDLLQRPLKGNPWRRTK